MFQDFAGFRFVADREGITSVLVSESRTSRLEVCMVVKHAVVDLCNLEELSVRTFSSNTRALQV
jgi:hypothetical protein